MREKGWHKAIVALVLTIAVGVSLWFAAPVSGLTGGISDPGPTYLYQAYGGGGGVSRDLVPPRISNVLATTIFKTTADIYWTTHEKSNSQVKYWSSPVMLSELDEEMVIDHHVRLTGLTPGTTYHYTTLSRDRSGNLAESPEATLTTLGKPATFSLKLLDITPAEVGIGEQVTISIVVSNTGDASGTYDVILAVDNVEVATTEVTLFASAEQKVTFTVSRDAAKTYSVSIGSQAGYFTVQAVAPPPPPPPPTPPPPITPPPPASPINWWLIGGILAAVLVTATVVWLTVFRQRA